MEPWKFLFKTEGDSLALLSSLSLTLEAFIDMHPISAIFLRVLPTLVGFGGAYVLMASGKLFFALLFLIGGLAALFAGMAPRPYWNAEARTSVNLTPIAIFAVTALILYKFS